MKIAIVAPSPVPYTVGGAEKLWWGMLQNLNQREGYEIELVKVPSPEQDFWQLMQSYRMFSEMDLSHFDQVISTKYPAWMVNHPNHHCYLQHKLRGLYDTYHFSGQPLELQEQPAALQPLLKLMEQPEFPHQRLPEFWAALQQARESLPEELFAFPGPLTRKIVHFLDSVALRPGSIKRYSAISHNVASRQDYFPEGVPVTVIHHPSDLPALDNSGDDYIFTISRLDGPKRIRLLIEAFMRTRGDMEFRIAGTGPEAESLRELAAPDPRVRFLGRINDAEVVRQYGGARFVPFIPYDEDYGLITIEAMQAGKPVITTVDAGGVNEFVEQGVSGYSVDVDADALADAMQRLMDDRQLAAQMGENARQKVAHVRWDITLDRLLAEPEPLEQAGITVKAERPRPQLVVALNFPVWPPRGGGQSRVYYLYREVAKFADVTLVTQTDNPQDEKSLQLLPGLKELRVAKSGEQLAYELQLRDELQASVTDIAAIEGYRKSPAYLDTLLAASRSADLVIASHPYLYRAIRDVYRGPLWYEAHNVELDMKRAVLQQTEPAAAEPYLEQVHSVEQACCRDSEQILVCSREDAQRLAELYQIDEAKTLVVANGVALDKTSFTDGSSRQRHKRRVGLAGRFVALFMGSWHGPNIEAVEWIKSVAPRCLEVDFMVFGSVCSHPVCDDLPANVYTLGLLSDEEKSVWLGTADLALNPMTSGSGTNLKMLDYAAAGLPILTTEFGNRGLEFRAEKDLLIAPLEQFEQRIRAMATAPEQLAGLVDSAYRHVQRGFDWSVIVESMRERLLKL
ncbi:glycosyltransferase family 4 protein [Marinobacterium arenosum]|uniref:glycosyltransferase family 4 protein n=1 Tax=Marinobacterium arenosum TaxID=2862496 RepID=UPI001C9401F6|nr:glycosyltransferase [Marinobacterium arenosum]MBY4676802.1 glycosyltransferase [Marinobacterium arenosum]